MKVIPIQTGLATLYNVGKAFDQSTGMDALGPFIAEQGSFNRPGVSPPSLKSVAVATEGAWDAATDYIGGK